MLIVQLDSIKQLIKNAITFCEKQNTFSIFDTTLIIVEENMIVLLDGNNGSYASVIKVENPSGIQMIIKTNLSILSKIIGNIRGTLLSLIPEEQGVLLIKDLGKSPIKDPTVLNSNNTLNFSIYSQNIDLDSLPEEEKKNALKPYNIYLETLFSTNTIIEDSKWDENTKKIEIESVEKFIDFLKQVNYAASTENDRDFSSIFFQWQNNKITANASNRIRIAISKIETQNSNNHNVLKFSCDKKSIHNVIKGSQNFEKEPLVIKVIPAGRIFFFLGKDVIIEVGYYKNRGINMEKFFDCMEDCCGFLCLTQDLKQALQGPKSFATKFHYAVLIDNSATNNSSFENTNQENIENTPENNTKVAKNQIRFYFQEPNHGTVESYLSCDFGKYDEFSVEMNVLYLSEAITVIDSKKCYIMINKKNSYVFIIPMDKDRLLIPGQQDSFSSMDLKEHYNSIHLLMCIG
jgi:DNA polymerase III sliding clamp (beta) subunit (PCNA family)